eukprot:GFKZ01012375.1.p1 GENE.GFKZ01012375.1~~GFKZ01012375.1.p1  ORF type:complete len:183 (-),score=6.17 GFKZ01012375.1:503-1051(-)
MEDGRRAHVKRRIRSPAHLNTAAALFLTVHPSKVSRLSNAIWPATLRLHIDVRIFNTPRPCVARSATVSWTTSAKTIPTFATTGRGWNPGQKDVYRLLRKKLFSVEGRGEQYEGSQPLPGLPGLLVHLADVFVRKLHDEMSSLPHLSVAYDVTFVSPLQMKTMRIGVKATGAVALAAGRTST